MNKEQCNYQVSDSCGVLNRKCSPGKKHLCLLLAALLLPVVANGAIPAYPGGGYGIPVAAGQQLFASGGDVTVTYQGWQGAAYEEYLFLASPANGFGLFFENHGTPAGTTLDLGTWAAGTEMMFGIYVQTTGNTWYDGPGSRNVDGVVHAYMANNYGSPNTTYVGFEDLDFRTGADANYKDEVFTFTGLTVVPEPGTYLAGLSALAMLGAFGWRSRK